MAAVPVPVDASPVDRLHHAAAFYGSPAAVARLSGPVLLGAEPDSQEFLLYLGGAHAQAMIEGRSRMDDYWLRVWAARALLYTWDPSVSSAVVAALSDDAWRVREMAAKVCLKRELGEAGDALAVLLDDPVPRVRAAACRALGAVGEAEYAPALRALRDDPEPDVRTRAAQALERLSDRLDRPLDADASS